MGKCREQHMKQIGLEEARKAGLAPAEVDEAGLAPAEDGKEINPHIPQYMSSAPWYLNFKKPSLKHQRESWKSDPNYTNRGAKTYQAEKYRKGACQNCGAITHDAKACMDIPRKIGAKYTNKNIAPDEKIESFELDYDSKRDDPSTYHRLRELYEARKDALKKYLKEQQIKKLEKKNNNQEGHDATSDGDEEDDDLRVDEAKVDESRQMDFASTEDEIPMELLLGQSERQVEYDRAGTIIEGQEVILPKSKYEEDVLANNHTSVWGSWWKDCQWGYRCCQQTIRNSYCTGSAGIEAAEAALDLMN